MIVFEQFENRGDYMLAEDRCKKILDILDSMGSVTVQQLMDS